MADFDIEKFPTSEEAKLMMSYITGNGWYDKSYVGKWIFQVMGIEMDKAEAIAEDLINQAFPETATWGLRYHEQKYGLPIREDMSYEERRKIIMEHRDLKAPMTPWRMEQIIGQILGVKTHVTDIMEDPSLPHPNVFRINLDENGTEVDMAKAIDKIRKIKQSHTDFHLYVTCYIGLQITVTPQSIRTDWVRCGTVPIISHWGKLDDINLQMSVSPQDYPSDHPLTNQVITGTVPVPSHGGVDDPIDLQMQMDPQGYEANPPLTGQTTTGTEPIDSTVLSMEDNSLSMGVTATPYAVQSKLCGMDDIL